MSTVQRKQNILQIINFKKYASQQEKKICNMKWNRRYKKFKCFLFFAFILMFMLVKNSDREAMVSGNHYIVTLETYLPDANSSIMHENCLYFENCRKRIPFEQFVYPLDVDMPKLVQAYRKKEKIDINPIFVYPFFSVNAPDCKCCYSSHDKGSLDKDILLVLVKSAPNHFQRRQAIRMMWGNEDQEEIKNMSIIIRTVFLIGLTNNRKLSKDIKSEIAKNKDIVQLSYIDAYYNNTYKTIGGLNWSVKNCSTAKFLLFIDDDFFANPVRIINYLESLNNTQTDELFLGRVWHDIPQRGQKQKWYMPISVYPFDRYPPFLSAGFMLMSMEFAQKIQIAIQYTKKFKFDDVFLAIVIHKLGVSPQHSDFIRIIKKTNYNETDFNQVLAAHGYSDFRKLQKAWENYKVATNFNLTQGFQSNTNI